MKDIIVLGCLLIVYFSLISEMTNIEITGGQRTTVNSVIDSYEQKVRNEGYWTPQLITEFKAELVARLKVIDASDISIVTDGIPKYRRTVFTDTEYITYDIFVSFSNLVKQTEMWGMEESDKNYTLPIHRVVSSERLN